MKVLTISLAMLIIAGLCEWTDAGDLPASLTIGEGLLDLSNPQTLGLKTVPGEHVELYHATDESGYRFSHHPGLVVFQGEMFCSWSSGRLHEDRPEQRVLYSRSVDGKKWSPPTVLAEPTGASDRCIAAGFHVVDDLLVAFYTVTRDYPTHNLFHPDNGLFARTSHDGQAWSEPRRVATGFFIERPLRLPNGRLIVGGEHVGDTWKTNQARMRLLYTDDPQGLSGWKEAAIEPAKSLPSGLKVFDYTEPGPFIRRDGVIVSPFRTTGGFLYASTSQDHGATWSVPQKTNFPDAMSRFSTGQFPDGTTFLINNPGPGVGNRSLLTIALSRDGVTFNRAWIIRSEPTRQRFVGKGKRDGWQYPNALVWKDSLYVAYSVNKEDVVLTRISLDELK